MIRSKKMMIAVTLLFLSVGAFATTTSTKVLTKFTARAVTLTTPYAYGLVCEVDDAGSSGLGGSTPENYRVTFYVWPAVLDGDQEPTLAQAIAVPTTVSASGTVNVGSYSYPSGVFTNLESIPFSISIAAGQTTYQEIVAGPAPWEGLFLSFQPGVTVSPSSLYGIPLEFDYNTQTY